MGKFGWSYPPGCSGTPWDDPDPPCEICGGDVEIDCICEECPECGGVGDLYCYVKHGMARTQQQIEQLERKEKEWREYE